MIGHVQTPEHEATAQRAICAGCRKVAIPHEETDQGQLCRGCTSNATAIRIDYVIGGRLFTKHLKRLAAVTAGEKGRGAARAAGTAGKVATK